MHWDRQVRLTESMMCFVHVTDYSGVNFAAINHEDRFPCYRVGCYDYVCDVTTSFFEWYVIFSWT